VFERGEGACLSQSVPIAGTAAFIDLRRVRLTTGSVRQGVRKEKMRLDRSVRVSPFE
jgi:hypothetical protein